MDKFILIIGYLIVNLVRTFIIYFYFDEIFKKQIKSKKYLILTYIFYYLLVTFIYLCINNPILTLITNILGIFSITLNYNSSIQRKIYFSAFLMIIFMSIEGIVMLLDKNANINLLMDNFYISTYKNVFIQIMSFVIIKLILRCKNINYTNIKTEKYNLYFASISILTTCIILTMFLSNKLGNLEIFIYTTSILLINMISLYMYDKLIQLFNENLKNNYLKVQSEYYEKNINILISHLKKTNSLKHDIRNHLLIVKSLSYKKEYSKLETYIESLTSDFNIYYNTINTGNVVIDSILNCKRYEMELKNISNDMNINITPELNIITNSDIVIILGNLIDNAIEATVKIDKEKRKIDLDINYEKGILIINIKNTYDGIISYKDNKIISSKNDSFSHGIGMCNVEEVIKKYNGTLNIDFNEDIFNVNLMFFT